MTGEAALINLVRADSLATSESLDAEANALVYAQADEVELINALGEPAAIPEGSWQDQDYQHAYAAGGRGYTPRRRLHDVSLAIDYLSNDTRQKLERWMHQRALVYYSPGYGRYTDVAYRPLMGTTTNYPDGTTTLKDLTGLRALESTGEKAYWWDTWLKVLRGAPVGNRSVWPTPFGAAQVCIPARTNRHVPGTPATADEGFAAKSGWRKGGTDSAQITFALVTNGFGHDDAPHSLRVTTTADISTSRHIVASTLWDSGEGDYEDYTFTGAGVASVVVWLKGRVSPTATLSFSLGASASVATLSSYDLSDWTPVYLSLYAADWTTAVPQLVLSLPAAAGDRANIEVGPVAVYQSTGANQPERPEWSAAEVDTTVNSLVKSAANYTMPTVGTAICAFYCPTGYAGPIANGGVGLMGHAAGLRLEIHPGPKLRLYYAGATYLEASCTLVQGAVNVVAGVWATGQKAIYFNGVQIGLLTTAANQDADIATAATLYFGTAGVGAMHPLLLLSARIDRRAYTSLQVARISKGLLDPVANAVAVNARGRTYRITGLPSTPRNSVGGTHWIGRLSLEEVEYSANLSDVVSQEAY